MTFKKQKPKKRKKILRHTNNLFCNQIELCLMFRSTLFLYFFFLFQLKFLGVKQFFILKKKVKKPIFKRIT